MFIKNIHSESISIIFLEGTWNSEFFADAPSSRYFSPFESYLSVLVQIVTGSLIACLYLCYKGMFHMLYPWRRLSEHLDCSFLLYIFSNTATSSYWKEQSFLFSWGTWLVSKVNAKPRFYFFPLLSNTF